MKRLALRFIGPSTAYLPLTQGVHTLIDIEDAERVEEFLWRAQYAVCIRNYYAVRALPRGRGDQEIKISLQSFILGIAPERESGLTGDHINRNSLDNRKCNLRPATRREQAFNRSVTVGSIDDTWVLTFHKKNQRWEAWSKPSPGVRIWLGSFIEKEEALACCQKAAGKAGR